MYIPMKSCILHCACLPFKGVLHIGAHGGEEAEDYQNNGVDHVVWVEGNADLMPSLKEKTRKFDMDQVYINECVSDTEEEIEFNIASNGQSSSILELGTHATLYPHITYTKTVKMTTRRMDEVIKRSDFEMSDINFLNLDVQGAELKVLKGMGALLENTNLKAIYTEVNFEHVYKECCLIEDLDEYLKKYGFRRIATVAPEKTWGDSLYARL